MCYSLYLSTTSEENFARLSKEHFSFEPLSSSEAPELQAILKYPNRWFLACRYGGCSCHFRHMTAPQLGSARRALTLESFGPVEDWDPEDEEGVQDTAVVYDLLERLLSEDNKVDVLDFWSDATPEVVEHISVSLRTVPRDHFRFFENCRFELSP